MTQLRNLFSRSDVIFFDFLSMFFTTSKSQCIVVSSCRHCLPWDFPGNVVRKRFGILHTLILLTYLRFSNSWKMTSPCNQVRRRDSSLILLIVCWTREVIAACCFAERRKWSHWVDVAKTRIWKSLDFHPSFDSSW